MRSLLFGWRGSDKEVCIEAFGHAFRRDPMSEVAQTVSGKPQIFGAGHFYQRTPALVKRLPVRIKMGHLRFRDRQYLPTTIGQQHPGFLK